MSNGFKLLTTRASNFVGSDKKNMGSPSTRIYRFKCFQASTGVRFNMDFKKMPRSCFSFRQTFQNGVLHFIILFCRLTPPRTCKVALNTKTSTLGPIIFFWIIYTVLGAKV